MFTLAQVLTLDPAFVEAEARREVRLDRGDPDELWRSTLNMLDGREPAFVPRWQDYQASAIDRLMPHLAELRRLHRCYGLANAAPVTQRRQRSSRRGPPDTLLLLWQLDVPDSCGGTDTTPAYS